MKVTGKSDNNSFQAARLVISARCMCPKSRTALSNIQAAFEKKTARIGIWRTPDVDFHILGNFVYKIATEFAITPQNESLKAITKKNTFEPYLNLQGDSNKLLNELVCHYRKAVIEQKFNEINTFIDKILEPLTVLSWLYKSKKS